MGGEAETSSLKFRRIAGRWIAILFSIFVIYSMATLNIEEMKQLSVFLSFSLTLIFIQKHRLKLLIRIIIPCIFWSWKVFGYELKKDYPRQIRKNQSQI